MRRPKGAFPPLPPGAAAYAGQKAQVRFTSVHDRSRPLFTGTVRTVSADSFTDEKTSRSYFRAEIVVPDSELRKVHRCSARRASPRPPRRRRADVRKRTALGYLMEPLSGALWRSGHED